MIVSRFSLAIDKRASQFAPFSALNGYDDMIKEKTIVKDKKIYLTEDEKILLNNKLILLNQNIKNKPNVVITYFDSDKRNSGIYKTIEVRLKKIDIISQQLILEDNKKILFENILDIKYEF